MRKQIKKTLAAVLVACNVMAGGMSALGAENTNEMLDTVLCEDDGTQTTLVNSYFSRSIEITKKEFKKVLHHSLNNKAFDVDIVYPEITVYNIKGKDIVASEKINDTIYKKIVNRYSKLVRENAFDKNCKFSIKSSYINDSSCIDCNISTVGNLLSIKMVFQITNETTGEKTEEIRCLNFNLENGNVIDFNHMFKKSEKLRRYVAEEYKNQNTSMDFYIFDLEKEDAADDETARSIGNKFSMANCFFTYSGLNIYTDQSVSGDSKGDIISFNIDYDDIDKYIRASKKRLMMPEDMIKIELPQKSSGTGYSWEGDETADSMFEVVYSGYKSAYKTNVPLSGGPVIYYVILKANGKAGKANLHFDYLRVWEGPDSTMDSCDYEYYIDETGRISIKK